MITKFILEIELGNSAFDVDWKPEVTYILRNAQRKLTEGQVESILHDHNGNVVGSYRVSPNQFT